MSMNPEESSNNFKESSNLQEFEIILKESPLEYQEMSKNLYKWLKNLKGAFSWTVFSPFTEHYLLLSFNKKNDWSSGEWRIKWLFCIRPLTLFQSPSSVTLILAIIYLTWGIRIQHPQSLPRDSPDAWQMGRVFLKS